MRVFNTRDSVLWCRHTQHNWKDYKIVGAFRKGTGCTMWEPLKYL